MKKLIAILLFPFAAYGQSATYSAASSTLSIPSLTVGNTTYSNVSISVDMGKVSSGANVIAEGTFDGLYQCTQSSGASFFITHVSNSAPATACSQYQGTTKNAIITGVSTGAQPFQYAVGCSVKSPSGPGSDYFSGIGADGKIVQFFFNGAYNLYWGGSTQSASCSKAF